MANLNSSFYIAVILYKSSTNTEEPPLYQECFTLLEASSMKSAWERAENHTRKEECSYTAEGGRTVSWTLERIVDVSSVLSDELEDETDLYARHFRDWEAYLSFEPLLSGEEL